MEAKFLTELCVTELPEEGTWRLDAELVYRCEILGKLIKAPQGFVTDFASVPRVPIVYTAFGDRAHRESVIHDYIYQTHLTDRATADKIFLEAMKSRGKPLWVRTAMYAGVRLGGASSYASGPERYQRLQG